MATTYLEATKLAKPGHGDRNWEIPLNYNSELLNGINVLGQFRVKVLSFVQSAMGSTLAVAVSAGEYSSSAGSPVNGRGTNIILPANSHVLVFVLESTGETETVATDGSGPNEGFAEWPTAPHVRIGMVITNETGVVTLTGGRDAIGDANHGGIRFYYGLVNAVDDAEAAEDIQVNCLYRNGSQVMIRVE